MSAAAVTVIHSDDNTMSSPEPGLRRQVMSFTDNMMLVRHRMVKGWVGALHSHPHEQMVYVVSGRISFSAEGTTVVAGPGDSFMVAGDVPHQASALEDSEILDVFTPYREDYAPKS